MVWDFQVKVFCIFSGDCLMLLAFDIPLKIVTCLEFICSTSGYFFSSVMGFAIRYLSHLFSHTPDLTCYIFLEGIMSWYWWFLVEADLHVRWYNVHTRNVFSIYLRILIGIPCLKSVCPHLYILLAIWYISLHVHAALFNILGDICSAHIFFFPFSRSFFFFFKQIFRGLCWGLFGMAFFCPLVESFTMKSQ